MAIEKIEQLVQGSYLQDSRKSRRIVLEKRINPMGASVPPYWAVTNDATGKQSMIREDRLLGSRYTITGGISAP